MLRKLEKYEILDEIGHGGMATVYRARDSRLDREVALKVMHPHLRGAHEARVRFTREARSVARLRHPNILEIYDNSDPDSEESYIAGELLTGPTLKHFAEKHPQMPAEIAACFAIEIARALGCAHDAGIVHRDVKPENVLLHEDRTVKLTDFGIAQMVDHQSMTATGQILGSPGHMAPEQIEGGHTDVRSDLFSLGTVLYFLSCGQLPFSGRNPHQVLKRIVDADYAHPLRVRPTVGARLARIIEKTLARSPADRPESAQALERELAAFVAEIGIDDPSATLARYLKDPDGVAAELAKSAITPLIAKGREANARGEIPLALDYWNRVLALDDGNEEVIRLVERAGRASRVRSQATIAGSLIAVVAAGGIAWAVIEPGSGNANGGEDVIELVSAELPDAGGERPDAQLADGSVRMADGAIPLQVTQAVDPEERPVVSRAPRLVSFRLRPQNVMVAIDDQPAVANGSALDGLRLAVGSHRVQVTADDGCCDEQVVTLVVPPGPPDERVVLDVRLPWRKAILSVFSNVPGRVEVGEGLCPNEQTCRTGSALEIPIPGDRGQAEVPVIVTAPGHRAYTETVRLRAGRPVQIRVTLEEEASGSSP